jgi:hypothetical protein
MTCCFAADDLLLAADDPLHDAGDPLRDAGEPLRDAGEPLHDADGPFHPPLTATMAAGRPPRLRRASVIGGPARGEKRQLVRPYLPRAEDGFERCADYLSP